MRKIKNIYILFLFLLSIAGSGCNHNSSEPDYKLMYALAHNSSKPVFDGQLEIVEHNISQNSVWFHDGETSVEGAQLTISWEVSKPYEKVRFEETLSGYSADVQSGYTGIKIIARYGKPLKIRLTPFGENSYGKIESLEEFIPVSDDSGNQEGAPLSEGIVEKDLSTLGNGDFEVFELEKSVLNLKNARDVSVYVARVNAQSVNLVSNRYALLKSSKVSPVNNSRTDYSEKETEGPFFRIDKIFGEDENNAESQKISEKYDLIEIKTENGTEIIKRISPDIKIDEKSVRFKTKRNGRAALDLEDFSPVDYKIEDKKTVYISEGEDPDNNQSCKNAILQYKSDNCYVWAVEDYFTEDENVSGAKINGEICKKIGKTLDEVIKLERNIFGQEWECLKSASGYVSMSENSKTGTIVNILLYDIQGDFVEGRSAGIYGFFTPGDYFVEGTGYNTNSASNGGKYLHIDSGFASDEELLPTVLSTVVHEFQHMIQYGQKKGYEQTSEVFFNEMCSMLAEDMFQTKLNLGDMDSAKFRFIHFMYSWRYLPFFTWSGGAASTYAYSNAFGLGSFVAKKYGGADFVYDYMHTPENTYGNDASFMEAVKLHDSSATKESVLRDLAVELCTGKVYKTEVASIKHCMDDYSYPMTGFDIKNPMNSAQNGSGVYYTKLDGHRELFNPDRIDVSFVGKITDEEDTVEFFGNSEAGIKEYIVLVKEPQD